MTFYEAVNEAFISLGINHNKSSGYLAYRSIVQSSNPRRQEAVSLRIWPKAKVQVFFGGVVGRLLERRPFKLARAQSKTLLLVIEILFCRKKLIRISGPSLTNTETLIDALEALQVLSKKPRFSKIVV
jgi:hypothetical protein